MKNDKLLSMRAVFILGFVLSLLLGFALGQSDVTLEQMRENLNDGYYAVAAQVLGPELVADEAFSNNPEAHYLYAQALYLNNSIPEARTELDIAFKLSDSPNISYQHLDALLFAAEGGPTSQAQALERLEAAFSDTPNYQVAMDWGRIAWQSNRLDNALRAFSLASETREGQKQLWPHLNRGRVLQSQGNHEAAIIAFNEAITVFENNDVSVGIPSPGYIEAFYKLGQSYEALDNLEEARLNYESAIAIGSNYPPAEEALRALGN